ncbi:Alpha-(1,6)-fucosyltransferase [Cocos nucifera]|uniref:Alpha-(1,6)-fucosyltransferase n=1 Tax=Cocos nucifera TaxID=13894 RepID=A0A8K0IKR9_COCNU|nr:Alpha-(1,6)-fucosyltransferase [Cocos nucifera]
METTTAPKSLERVISQKALQISSSTSCKLWVLGFFCGVCITYLFLVSLTPFRTQQFGLIFSSSSGAVSQSSSMKYSDVGTSAKSAHNFSQRKYISLPEERGTLENSQASETLSNGERVLMLYSAWSALLDGEGNIFVGGLQRSNVPQAPHLENCRSSVEANKHFDNYGENGSFPPWTLWKGLLGLDLLQQSLSKGPHQMHFGQRAKSEGAYPPWIVGSDEDNFPLTRQVQRDIWIHQHPQNCNDPSLRFLVADWERIPGFGMGAQLAGMAGLLAIAVNEKRILVTNYYNRADHSGCQGSLRSHWSCYFFPETSLECQKRAFDLLRSQEAWKNGIITVKENYTSKEIWAGRIPRIWGDPWSYLQPTTDIGGNLLRHHRKMDRRWWRAQAIRYLMRFQSEYTCGLLNTARHKAFGLQAAKMVVENLPVAWPKVVDNRSQADIERFVWSNHKPWVPRPLLSMHARMGDKACEMKVVGFETYMQLAERIRERFPNLDSIWLSTEMQEVIDKSRLYPYWNFYYTNVTRQIGNMTMAAYEASLGREIGTNYPLVNFIMATEADFFIGALGSTWCYLIDGMRNTGGKVMAGYLSVNKDRFW